MARLIMIFVATGWMLWGGSKVWAGEPADWMRDARWGIMTHYLGAPPSSVGGAEAAVQAWNKQVDAFDVQGLVKQVSSTGAKYLLFTIGQNSGYYCAPNATYDRLVGIRSSTCSRRDLVADLARALKPHDIKLMVYLPSGAPASDVAARTKLKWLWGARGGWQLPGEPVGGRLEEFQRNWEAICRDWSMRWGRRVAGWWIDGCYFADVMYRHADEPNFASFARALKAGNPDSLVAFNPGVKVPVICHAKEEDYTAGEVNLDQMAEAVRTCPGRWIQRDGHQAQFQILSYLGKSWCSGEKPAEGDEKIIGYVRDLNAKGGVVTWDVPIETNGLIRASFLKQLEAIGRAVK